MYYTLLLPLLRLKIKINNSIRKSKHEFDQVHTQRL